VAFSPDGTHIVSSSDDKTIRAWNVATGEQVLTELRRHDDLVSSVVFSADGNHIVSGSKEGKIQIWDAISGTKIVSLPEEECRQLGNSIFPEEPGVISDPTASSTIDIDNDGWITDSATNEKISKLPPAFNVKFTATCGRSLVVGASDGQFLVIHFPATLGI
jgi:WD40 repeat protein